MEKIKTGLIIFDLDGTIIDSSEDIAWATNRTLARMGYKKLPVDRIKENIGWGVKSLLEKLMPDETPESIEAARKVFLEFYGTHLVVSTYLYPGVEETVGYFQGLGKKMAVVTNKPVKLAEEILEELKLMKYFMMVLGGDSLSNRKPHPEPVEKVMEAASVPPERTVLMGDSPMDCEAGKRAGVFTIGVTYGFRSRAELALAGFDVIIGRFTELKDVIN